MFRVPIMVVVLGSIATSALGQDCTSISDAKERLTCYDKQQSAAPKAKDDPIFGKARAAVREELTDPGSARFEQLTRRGNVVCGLVNSKGRQGGYVGRVGFIYLIKENEAIVFLRGVSTAASTQRGAVIAGKSCKGAGIKWFDG